MEFYLLSSPFLTTSFSILVLSFLLFILTGKRPYRRDTENQKPPQANGSWPIIGHLHLLGRSKLAHKVLGDMAEKHGPIFTINLGVHQALVVSNWEIAKDCYTTNDKIFASRPKSEAIRIMCYNYAMFGVAPYGDYWRKMRKIITHEVLSQRRVAILEHIRVSELRASIIDLYETWVKNKSEDLDMVKMDMGRWFGNLVLNNLVRIISGKRFSRNDEQGVWFQAVVKKHFELLGAFVVSEFIPFFKFLDVGGYKKAMKKTGLDLDNIIEGWLKDHKTERSKHEHIDEGNQYFLDVLIDTLEGASNDEFSGFDHDTVIKSTCEQLLTAGLDTTSVTLTWALSLLLNNPKTLEIAQNELDKHVGRERLVEESDMNNLVYLDAIIKETFRLHPAGPLSVPRESMEDCTVGGYHVPKGTRLLVNLWKMHRDPNVWSEPLEFRPERFLTSHKNIDFKGMHFMFLPFGSGRRMCPGVGFSVQILGLTLASLIQQFILKTPLDEPVDMSETQGLANYKARPLDVLLAPRLSANMYHVA